MTSLEIASTIQITLRVGLSAVLLDLLPAVAAGFLIARGRFRGKSWFEAFVSLPLVLPPVAIGYLLLILLAPRGAIGRLLEPLGLSLLFTWQAAAIASAVMAFPLLARSAAIAFAEVPPRLEQVARTLGAGSARCFLTVTLPLARRGIAYGILLAFLRALGEFGATVLVAGNIPGRTQTLALGIYDAVQTGRDADALVLAGVSIGASLLAVLLGERWLQRRSRA